jgi:glycosyltransferase involved in cell wall biosynthesis
LKHLPLHLVFVGSANIGVEGYAEELLRAAAGDPRIRFVGWLDNRDLFRYMDMADMAIFPASQSILWVQAVSMGLPLVVGNSGSQGTDYMNAYDNIIELPREDIRTDKLVEVIEALVSDTHRLARMREGARRTFTEVLDWNTLVWKTIGQPLPPRAGATAA